MSNINLAPTKVNDKMMDLSELVGILTQFSKGTGKKFGAENFYSRLRTQKSIYLLQAVGNPLVKGYRFSLYHYGPYSPSLAKDYYKIMEKRIAPTPVSIGLKDMSFIKGCNQEGVNLLEAVATLHLVYDSNRIRAADGSEGLSKGEAMERALDLKPKLSNFYERAWDVLDSAGLI